MTLHSRILVADDQRDVAITLTSGLRKTGAAVVYVADGEEALQRVQAGGIDLVVLDMKMPPGDWGGLWVLAQMRERRLTAPVIVLTGEGGQRQTIEAIRLEVNDWIDKGAAGRELLERCGVILGNARQKALDAAAQMLPSPVAHSFGRYATAFGHERSVAEGLRAFEDTVKFAAMMALADRPADARGIPGVQPAQFARPSLGTWVSVARGLVAEGDRDGPAATWLAALLPDRGSVKLVQELVTLRNDIAHGGHDATKAQSDTLRDCLVDVAHRLSSAWRWQLHVVASLEYDGISYDVRTLRHAGMGAATPSAFVSSSPMRTGEVVLTGPDGQSLLLAPWFELVDVEGQDVVGIYDSVPLPRNDTGADPPLQYADPMSRSRGLNARTLGATWSRIRQHVDRA